MTASGGYDGSITIDTHVDPEGVNKGTEKIAGKMGDILGGLSGVLSEGVLGALADIVLVVGIVVAVAAAAIGAIVGLVGAIGGALKTAADIFGKIDQMGSHINGLQRSFQIINQEIQGAMAPLIALVIPYMQQLADWLLVVGNRLAMIIASLLGQKTVWQAVKIGAQDATKAIGQMNNNLAAFDKLNTLQSPQAVQLKQVAVPADYAKKSWQEFLDWFNGTVIKSVVDWFNGLPIVQWFKVLWATVQLDANSFWTWLQQTWIKIGPWWEANVSGPVGGFFKRLWANTQLDAHSFWTWLQQTWIKIGPWWAGNVTNPIDGFFKKLWATIQLDAHSALTWLQLKWTEAKTWIKGLPETLKLSFEGALDGIKNKWETVWNGMGLFLTQIINKMIDNLNGLLNRTSTGINGLINSMNSLGGGIPGWQNIPTTSPPQIPHLATGAVIPPNSRFAAVLGDQRSGNNIEAPQALFQSMLDQAVNAGSGSQTITIRFEGTMAQFVQAMKPHIDQENLRVGKSLVRNVPGYIATGSVGGK